MSRLGFVLAIVVGICSPALSSDLIPYEVTKREEMGTAKISFDIRVGLINGRLPTKEELGEVSKYLKSKESKHDRTFVAFWLPGMAVGLGAFATAHHNPNMNVIINDWAIPDKYTNRGDLEIPIYDSVAEAIESSYDFSESNGTFKLLKSGKTPHIRLSPQIWQNDPPNVVIEEVKRAMLYGIFRSFLQTKKKKIKVTVSSLISDTKKYDKAYSVTIEIGRAEALAVAKRLLGIKKERELVDLKKVEGKVLAGWSQVFQKAYYNGYSPGLNRFYSEIKKGAKKHKSKRREL